MKLSTKIQIAAYSLILIAVFTLMLSGTRKTNPLGPNTVKAVNTSTVGVELVHQSGWRANHDDVQFAWGQVSTADESIVVGQSAVCGSLKPGWNAFSVLQTETSSHVFTPASAAGTISDTDGDGVYDTYTNSGCSVMAAGHWFMWFYKQDGAGSL